MVGKIFAYILVALQLGASVAYGFKLDIRHCLYWLFAAGINMVVTF